MWPKKNLLFLLIAILLISCDTEESRNSISTNNWDERTIDVSDSLFSGSTYLSIYSEINSIAENKTHDLTVTVSMRNTSLTDSIFLKKINFFNSGGELIRSFVEIPIYLLPMETLEIVINQDDKSGGTGGNFWFDWSSKSADLEPFFESVMISTSGQQGISFTSQGIRVQ